MPGNNSLRTLIISLFILIMINLSLALLGGLIELPFLVHFWFLALYGILTMGLLILGLGCIWTVRRLSRLWHHPSIDIRHQQAIKSNVVPEA